MTPDETEAAIVVALGSNIGWNGLEPAAVIRRALDEFPDWGLQVKAKSRLWRSAAWPDPAAPGFVNAVATVETALEPEALMGRLLEIEVSFGRLRDRPNAPRSLDLDLIAYGRRMAKSVTLILPHPRAHQRLFVIGPLAEIAPGWRPPGCAATARELAARCTVGTDAHPI